MPSSRGSLVGVHRSPDGGSTHAASAHRPSLDRHTKAFWWYDDAGIRLALSSAALFVVTTLCKVVDLDTTRSLAVLALGLFLGCLVLPVRLAVLAATIAWGYLTGFVVNAAGLLTFTGDDLLRMGLLVSLGVVAAGVGRWARS